jgi:N-acetylneuraminic acid mutarotase
MSPTRTLASRRFTAAALTAVIALPGCHDEPVGPSHPADRGQRPELAVTAQAASNQWTSSRNMLTPRMDLVAATAGGQVYAIGGRNDHYAVYSRVEAFTPSYSELDGRPFYGTWSVKAPLPAPRWGASGGQTINGKIYVPGGSALWLNTNSSEKTLFVYDPVANSWASKSPMPVKNCCGASAAIQSQLYVLTPAFLNGRPMLHRYDSVTDRWTELASPPHDHSRPVGGVINGKFYVMGGEFTGSEKAYGQASATLDVYDPATNRWTTKSAAPTGRYSAAGRVVNGKLVVVGGIPSWEEAPALNSVEVYDPATNTWATREPMPTARYLLAAAQLDGFLYALGGHRKVPYLYTGLATNEAYSP